MIRTVIVDDEPLARERLRMLLATEPDIEVVAECADGLEAADAIRRGQPDLLFLDVQMPERDGFRVLEALEGRGRPLVVFVTAHPQYAVRAFDTSAADYLLKPFDRERFSRTLVRVRERLAQGDRPLKEQLTSLLERLGTPEHRGAPERLPVRTGQQTVLVRLSDIDWVESAGNYVTLHVGKEEHLLRETLSALESRLPSRLFVRVHRKVIVNVERIQALTPTANGDHHVQLRGGRTLTLSRTYRSRFEELLGSAL